MNILIDLLPKKVVIEGNEYDINSDFRYGILFELLMQDNNIYDEDKIIKALELYYPVIPQNINEAIEKMLWFYKCGKDVVSSKGKSKGKGINSIYSFEHDDDYIYSAFMSQYSIDLQDIKYLHWWKFKALFKSLKEDNEIVKIMGYRSMDISKIKDKEQKAYYKKMQDIYEIPMPKDDKNKLDEINNVLLNGGNLKNIL